jgi:NADH-quinone oxidoreductase subunit N
MMPAAAYPPLAGLLGSLGDSVGGILPELALCATFLVGLLLILLPGKQAGKLQPWVILAGIVVAAVLAMFQLPAFGAAPVSSAFLGMVMPDGFAAWFKVLLALPALLTVYASMRARRLRELSRGMGEYYLMVLAMLIGMYFLVMAQHFVMLFLALELVSLPAYVLTAYMRLQQKSAEAAMKYVIYGSFSSGVMLYGLSWLYGMTGSLDPTTPEFAAGLATVPLWSAGFVLVLVLAGLSFKIGAMPFHFWVPDVYEGAPYPVAAFFSVAPKAAGFAVLMRLLAELPLEAVPGLEDFLALTLAVLAIGSMVVGNLSALRQTNFRRMLAYSSIAQAGYLLAGVACMSAAGDTAVVFYLTVYTFATYAAFMVSGWMAEELGSEEIDALRGLAGKLPLLAVLLALWMVALTGLPPTAGFIAKLQIFLAAVGGMGAGRDILLLVLMVAILLNTVVSLFYYLRPPSVMVFKNPALKTSPRLHAWLWAVFLILSLPVLWLGIISFDGCINYIGALVAILNV